MLYRILQWNLKGLQCISNVLECMYYLFQYVSKEIIVFWMYYEVCGKYINVFQCVDPF